MEKVVFVIGAGFSAPFGIPVMSNFLEKSKDLYFSENKKYQHFGKILEKVAELHSIKSYYNSDLLNIEEILSILYSKSILENKEDVKEFSDFIIDVVDHYTPKIKKEHVQDHNQIVSCLYNQNTIGNYYNIVQFFFGLFNLEFVKYGSNFNQFQLKNKKYDLNYSIISLNYDMIIENTVEHISNIINPFTSEFTVSLNKNEPNDNSVNFYKLHGSVDAKEIIPPIWNKSVNKKQASQWENAFKCLSNANHIIYLGYSLPESDNYIKYFLKAGASKSINHLKKIDILCLDPHGDVKKRYEDMITYKKMRFLDSDIKTYLQKFSSQFHPEGQMGRGILSTSYPSILEFHESFFNK